MEMWDWLLNQTHVMIVMGIVIYYLYKEYKALQKSSSKIIEAKDITIISITEKVLTVATLWDVKSDLNTKEHDKITSGVEELTDLVKEIRNECNTK